MALKRLLDVLKRPVLTRKCSEGCIRAISTAAVLEQYGIRQDAIDAGSTRRPSRNRADVAPGARTVQWRYRQPSTAAAAKSPYISPQQCINGVPSSFLKRGANFHPPEEVAMSIIHWCWCAFWDILKLLVVWSTGAQALWTAGKVHHQQQKKWFAKFFESQVVCPHCGNLAPLTETPQLKVSAR